MNLLRSELYKLKRNRIFKLLLIISIVFQVTLNLSLPQVSKSEDIKKEIYKNEKSSVPKEMYNFRIGVFLKDYENLNAIKSIKTVFSGNLFITIIILFTILFTINDLNSNNTLYAFSKGVSKYKIFFSKIIATITANVAIFICNLFACFIITLIFFGVGSIPESFLFSLICYLLTMTLLIIACMSFFVMISLILKKRSLAIVINILIILTFKHLSFSIDYLTDNKYNVSQYWILNIIEKVNYIKIQDDLQKNIIIMVCYTLISLFICNLIFNKNSIYSSMK